MNDLKKAEELFMNSIEVKQATLKSDQLQVLVDLAVEISDRIREGGKVLFCGNGGSAADAQHLAAELLVRLRPHVNREGIPAIALAMDSSTMTACANDFSYEDLYSRMVETLGKPEDVIIGITTSGRSENVIRALRSSKKKGMLALGFLGCGGGPALEECDGAFVVPSDSTGRIQECHITAGHCLMELIEDNLMKSGYVKSL
jgi:D-sedoheptulose 7-phosphate isomerase